MDDQIRSVLAQNARLPVDIFALSADDDLYATGLTSHASVNIMLALEDLGGDVEAVNQFAHAINVLSVLT